MTKKALVLGGGGVAGIAWETGLLAGLTEAGVPVLEADLMVGTSAGSTVAAQVTSGVGVEELFRRQVDPAFQVPELPRTIDTEALMAMFAESYDPALDPGELRRRVGAMALKAPTVPEAERRPVIEARLPSHDWPALEIKIVAVDAETGEDRVFDATSGVSLVDAVTASCAVPGVWPPATIGGRRYVDGAVRSPENADLAEGYERVLVVQVMEIPGQNELEKQVAFLRERGSEVMVIGPDEAAAAAMGPNLLDPAKREPAATAGREQGLRAAPEVAGFLK
ncbi:patatin-like phospholipase family protein [Amycolatopsis pigmentata]|uniref:Patatin-like phospholipase family protein n=1 Tax=Amycolatopsis pigmentata TaxID=450801 RepID=A0ABW5FLV0_9PSEU